MVTQTYTISTVKNAVPPKVKMSQYDSASRTIVFTVVDSSGSAVSLTGKTVTVEGTRIDGHAFAAACTVSGSTATFTETADMTNQAGDHPAELVVRESGQRLGTMNFIIAVEAAAMDEDAEITEEDQSLFDQLYTSIDDAEAEIGTAKDAALQEIAQGLASGSPLIANTAAAMTDTDEVYLYTGTETGYTAGSWYYYNGSSWVVGGVYGAGTTDATLTLAGVAADAKATGDAVGELKSESDDHSDIISANLMGVDVQENLYPGSADWNGTWENSDSAVLGLSDIKISGYPAMYSSQSYRRIYKEIPVTAGKTYTFEALFRHDTIGAAFLYLIWNNHTTNPATVSANFKRFNNTPANTWVKLSFTFTCSASGNISPYCYSGAGAFYVAKYVLVEGNSVFSLEDALDGKASTDSVSGIGDYLNYTFSNSTAYDYWNPEITMSVSSGTKCKLIFDSFSGDYLSYVRVDGKKSDNTYTVGLARINSPTHGAEAEFTTAENYVGFRIQFYSTTAEAADASIFFTTTKELGIANELLSVNKQRVYYINADGSGDFTSFVDGINEACSHMDSIVYVGAGTYDLLDELGTDYVEGASSTQMGLVLKNRVHVICSSQTILKMDYDGTLSNAKEYLSPINAGVYGFTLENATIIDNNVRYSVHDDLGWSGDTPYVNKYINCTMIHKNGMYVSCIGGGLGENCAIEIRGCYLEGDNNVVRLAYYHGNNHTGIDDAIGRLTVCDNYFAGVGTFQMMNYGDSEKLSIAYVSNNSFGTAPSVVSGTYAPYTNVAIKAWNNEIRT